ncbi:MAG: hypothetical protein ACRD3E_18740 [Terriglobales bacterium]
MGEEAGREVRFFVFKFGTSAFRYSRYGHKLSYVEHVERAKLYLIIGGIVFALALLAVVKHACNGAGYWPHREKARVYEGSAAWPAGELRKCEALPRQDGTIYFLGCVAGAENFDDAHAMTVTFWGQTERPDRFRALHSDAMEGWAWNCKKSGESLTCYAVN